MPYRTWRLCRTVYALLHRDSLFQIVVGRDQLPLQAKPVPDDPQCRLVYPQRLPLRTASSAVSGNAAEASVRYFGWSTSGFFFRNEAPDWLPADSSTATSPGFRAG